MANFMPTGYGLDDPNLPPEIQGINQKRKMAEILRQQSMQAPEGQMVSGHYVAPSITNNLARLLQTYQSGKMNDEANKQTKDYQAEKNRALAAILQGNKPAPAAPIPEAAPLIANQQDNPLGGMQTVPQNIQPQPQLGGMQPIQQPPAMSGQQPQAAAPIQPIQQANPQAALIQYMQKYGNTPEGQAMMAELNHQRDRGERKEDLTEQRGYEDKLYNRGRTDKLSDIQAEQKYQDIVRKDQQGFQVSQQDRNFAQQYKLQAQNQGFQAGQQSRSQAFQSGENEKNREQQLVVAGLKGGANSPAQKVNDAKDVLGILKQAAPLINQSTNSGLGNIYDQGAAFFGNSTPGAQSAASLKALEGSLVSKMPKMSGPQSDKDVLLYKQMAGQIGDPTLPAAQKKAAMDTILKLNSQYAGVPYEPLDFGDVKMTPTNALGGLPSQDAIAAELARRGRK